MGVVVNGSELVIDFSVLHTRYADRIISLDGDGRIKRQGSIDTATDGDRSLNCSDIAYPPVSPHSDERQIWQDPGVSEDTSRRAGDLTVYAYYVRVVGRRSAFAYLFICAAYIVTVNFSCGFAQLHKNFWLMIAAIWLQWWTNANHVNPNKRLGYWFGIYSGIAIAALLGYVVSDWYESSAVMDITQLRKQFVSIDHDPRKCQ